MRQGSGERRVMAMKRMMRLFSEGRHYRKLALILAVVVTFTTVYSLVLPAVTLTRSASERMAGIDLGSSASRQENARQNETSDPAPADGSDPGEAGAGRETEPGTGVSFDAEVREETGDSVEFRVGPEIDTDPDAAVSFDLSDPAEDGETLTYTLVETVPPDDAGEDAGTADSTDTTDTTDPGQDPEVVTPDREDPQNAEAPAAEAAAEAPDFPEPEEKALLAETGDSIIAVTYGPGAGIPNGSELAVHELRADSEAYDAHIAQIREMLEGDQTEAGAYAGPSVGGDEAFFGVRSLLSDPTGFDQARTARKNAPEIVLARLFDITILHNGEAVEPEEAVRVSIDLMDSEACQQSLLVSDSTQVVHFGEEPELVDADVTGNEVLFDADGFSVYAVVYTQLKQTVVSACGETYEITVAYDPSAGIPDGAELEVRELLRDGDPSGQSPDYDSYLRKTEDLLGYDAGDAVRLFDIRIVDAAGEKVPIAAPVQVSIRLADYSSEQETRIVHFSDGEETGSVISGVGSEEDQITFITDGFSVYAVVPGPDPFEPAVRTASSLEDLTDSDAASGFYLSVKRNTNADNYFQNDLLVNTKGSLLRETTNISAASVWYLQPAGGANQFLIYTYDNNDTGGVPKYLKQVSPGNNNIEFGDESAASVFEAGTDPIGPFSFKLSGTNKYLQHSNGGGGIRLYDGTGDARNSQVKLTFASSLSVPRDPYSLDGLTCSLISYNDGVFGRGLMAEANNGTSLKARSLLVRPDPENRNDTLYIARDSDVTDWTFRSVGEDRYTLSASVSGEERFLKIDASGISLAGEDEASEVQVIPGTGENQGKIRLTADGKAVSFDGSSSFKAADDQASSASLYFNLAQRSELTEEDFVVYSAEKVSVSDTGRVTDKTSIIIYKRVWNDETKNYEFYAIDHDGTLVPCYEKGSSIEWVGRKLNSLLWEFNEYYYEGTATPNYYYDLYNPYSGKYIAPQIKDGQILSDSRIGINLSGRRHGDYYTPIMAWDDPYYAYAGLKSAGGRIVSCPLGQSEDFYFAVMQPAETQALTTVPALDHTQYGITMRIIDYGTEKGDLIRPEGTDTSRQQHETLGVSKYEPNKPQHLLSTKLNADGYPDVVSNPGHSLSELYADAYEVNHLFLESIYNGTGYFEFDSAQNFASLQDDNSFKLYKELGTMDSSSKPSLKHGQFMPFNDLDPDSFASVNGLNLYDAEQNPLPDDDPRKYEPLYLVKDPNYFFGLEIEAGFVQTPSGLDAWGHDIIYELTGDDDFWLYVDGELVLDLGGIHSALPGKVNYSTGEVVVNGTPTTLYDIFRKNYADRNEVPETDPSVTEHLKTIFVQNDAGQYVFKDYSQHTMKIFFMERGAGASNLHMRFNLTSVRENQVLLQKKLSGTDELDYNLSQYGYQIFYSTEEDPDTYQLLPLRTGAKFNVTYPKTNAPVRYLRSYTLPGGGTEYENVYFLSAGDTAAISLPENTHDYYIRECGVNTQIYDTVKVNSDEVTGTPSGSENRMDYAIPPASVSDRQRVEFDNHVNKDAVRTLTIEKKLFEPDGATPIHNDPTGFSFRLYLGNENDAADDLTLADTKAYCVKDPDGNYCRRDPETDSFASLGKTSFASLTEEEKDAAVFHTSPNGSISKIPADYKVEVRDLLAGTRFKVEERAYELPPGYSFISYERNSDTYIVEEGENVNSGIIRPSQSPVIEVNNKRGWGLTAGKAWSDASFMDYHGDVYVAVYVKGELLDGTIRRLKHPATSVYYYWDGLEENASFSDYSIREVTLTGGYTVDEETNAVTLGEDGRAEALEEGKGLTISAQSKEDAAAKPYDYKVSYSAGPPEGGNGNVRTDTITNSRHGIRLIKTDPDGRALPGASFTLTDHHGNTVGSEAYTSDETGLITIAYVNVDTEYTLTETAAPAGCHAADPITFKVSSADTSVEIVSGDESGYTLTQASGDEMAALTIRNRPFVLEAVKEGMNGGAAAPLGGAHFRLYVEKTVGGVTSLELYGEAYRDLSSDNETGIIPLVDQTLPAGPYCLEETAAPGDYDLLSGMVRFTIDHRGCVALDEHDSASLTQRPGDGGEYVYTLHIVNEVRSVPVTLKKVSVSNTDPAGTETPLAGAAFTVYTAPEGEAVAVAADGKTQLSGLTSSGESETAGIFFRGNLKPGKYYLEETRVPDGHNAPPGRFELEIPSQGDPSIRAAWVTGDPAGRAGSVTGDAESGFVVTVQNTAGYQLPSTGGIGTPKIYAAGLTAVIAAGICLAAGRKREREQTAI